MNSTHTPGSITVGVLSDTHGHLYPQVVKLLEGVDHIIHAGDIGSLQVLAALRAIVPVTAVRGNCDHYDWAASLPAEAEVEIGGVRILVGHIAGRLRETKQGFRVVVTGHTHRMESAEREGLLYLNPGSAGPERFGHPRTMALLHVTPPAQSGAPAQVSAEFLMVPEA
jgi:putative phosphoesterase